MFIPPVIIITNDDVQAFQRLYSTHTGTELSYAAAFEGGTQLVALVQACSYANEGHSPPPP